MFRIIIIFISFFMAVTVFATPIAEQSSFLAVEKELTKNANIAGDFEQTRQISGLDNTLKSTGTFKISSESGLYWSQEKPFKSTLKVTKNRLEQQIMDNPPTILTRDKQPVVFSFTQVFMSILQGNTEAIDKNFNAKFSGDVSSWQMSLTPKNKLMSKAIKNISLTGGKTIDTIKVTDMDDNIVNIKFSNVVVE